MLELREYQKEAINSLYSWFEQNEGNPLLSLPTASGKSVILAKICQDALSWPDQRVLVLSHVGELITQDFEKLIKIWKDAPAGIYSASLGKRDAHHAITFATIQSVYKKPNVIGWRSLIIIDEAHLLSDSDTGMYRTLIKSMKNMNPQIKIIGLSATIFRTKTGLLHHGENALFHGIAYELPILKLMKEGWLCPLISKASVVQGNTDNIGIQAGEFSLREAETEFDRQEMTQAAVEEMLVYGRHYNSWLIFCVTIAHAEHVRDVLIEKGIIAEAVSEKTPAEERERILREFKNGTIRAVTNVQIVTTGIDIPNIDLIVFLRPTLSPGLYIQMAGRGTRPVYAPDADLTTEIGRLNGISLGPKPMCLILDFAGVTILHGPLTHVKIPEGGKRKDRKERDGKTCPQCQSVNLIDAKQCLDCGHEFVGNPRKIRHSLKASHAEVISEDEVLAEEPIWLDVERVLYEKHIKLASPDSVKVTYICKHYDVSEWICCGHSGFARKKAETWWFSRNGLYPCPTTADEALARLEEIDNVKCAKIKVKKDGKYQRVLSYDLKPMEIENAA